MLLAIQNFNGYCQVVSNCNIASELRNAYEYDVSQLALSRIIETNSIYMDSITIPETVKDTIWTGLAAIFNAFSIPERDSVFDIYCIHEYHCFDPPIQTVGIQLDSSYSWTEHWMNGELVTGYQQLDDFLSEYNFQLSPNGVTFLYTYNHINLEAFIDSLKKFEGIINAGNGELNCCHNKILYNKTNNTKVFIFDLGFVYGNFFCPNHYSWKFEIDDECNVKLLESKHNISDPNQVLSEVQIKNCQITTVIRNPINKDFHFLIKPNPTNDLIYIRAETIDIYSISISNILGKRVYQNEFTDDIYISLANHPPGLYIINIHNDKKMTNYNLKIIRR